MFDKALFDKTLFDRSSSKQAVLYATITAQYGLVAEKLRFLVNIGEASLNAISAMNVGALALQFPIIGVTIAAQFAGSARLSAFVPIQNTIIVMETALKVPALRAKDSEEMSLNGINLGPGQTLVIDTDSLDILLNDEQNVDCWQAGSDFFKLIKGDNELRFYDNASNRTLNVTVLWADRYK